MIHIEVPRLIQPFPALLASAALLAACATSDFDPARVGPAPDPVPARFVNEAGAGASSASPEAGCRSPMVDPESGTALRMIRSSRTQGDYAAPAGAYGLAEDELLRLDCASGRVIGVVRR